MRAFSASSFVTYLPLVAALACSGSDSGTKQPGVGNGGQGAFPGSGGAGSGSGGESSNGGDPSSGGVNAGAGGAGTSTGGVAAGSGGGNGCTTQCFGTSSLSTTCANSQVTQDCGTICASRGLIGSECFGADCVCTPPPGSGGANGAGGNAGCTTSCEDATTLKETCGGSVSTMSCDGVCGDRGLSGTQCVANDCLCTGTPGCTTDCAGNSLRKTCGGSISTQDCGTICAQRGLVGTECSGTDCACHPAGTGGSGGSGTGGATGGCTTTCHDDDPTYHQSTHVDTTCNGHTTSVYCSATGAPCALGLATCENNACKCL